MPDITRQTMTVKELADYCHCTKIPINKQIQRLRYPVTYKLQQGKKVTAYTLTPAQLSSLYETIQRNKSQGIVNDTVTNNPQPVTSQAESTDYKTLLDKYIEYRELYAVAQNSVKLLEDRQGGYIQQLKEIQSEKETLIKDNATLTVEVATSRKTATLYRNSLILCGIVSVFLLLLVLASLIIK